MTQPTETPTPESSPAVNDQWNIIWRTFSKNRMAVLGAALILVLVTSSVFAPFLANGKPLWYRGYNRFQYQEALRTLRVLTTRFAENKPAPEPLTPPANPAATASPLDTPVAIRLQAKIMSQSLSQDLIPELNQKINSLLALPPDQRKPAVATLQSELRDRFDPRKIQFVSRSSSPVIAGLHWAEIFCMTLNLLLLSFPLWNRWLPKNRTFQGKSFAARWRLAIMLLSPAIAAFAWWLTIPDYLDRTPYERGVLSTDSEKISSAPVVFDSIIKAPVPFDLDSNNLDRKYSPPSREHILGTDEVGRDVLSRMIWGGRISLSVGFIAVSINVIIGVIVGAVAGYFRGTWDLVISRIIEIVICFPSFFLILTIVAFIGPSIFNIMVILGLIGWTGIAQLVRGEFLRLGEQEFILAARALGFSPARIIFLHVLPNAMAPVLVSATFGVAGAILTESALSFLGLGITAPKPSWGGILSSAREAIRLAPWLIYFPGGVIFLTITAYNLVGETLRDAADPRLRGSR